MQMLATLRIYVSDKRRIGGDFAVLIILFTETIPHF